MSTEIKVERGEWTTFRKMCGAGVAPASGTLWEMRGDDDDEERTDIFILVALRHPVYGSVMVDGLRLAGCADGCGIDVPVRSVVVVMKMLAPAVTRKP